MKVLHKIIDNINLKNKLLSSLCYIYLSFLKFIKRQNIFLNNLICGYFEEEGLKWVIYPKKKLFWTKTKKKRGSLGNCLNKNPIVFRN